MFSGAKMGSVRERRTMARRARPKIARLTAGAGVWMRSPWRRGAARAERYRARALGRRMGPKKRKSDLILETAVLVDGYATKKVQCCIQTMTYVPQGTAMVAIVPQGDYCVPGVWTWSVRRGVKPMKLDSELGSGLSKADKEDIRLRVLGEWRLVVWRL
jgi:hypothetical protein